MKFDFSYGIIPIRRTENCLQVLLVQHQSGHWAFPKGHAELGETPQQTAVRELKEETGLGIKFFYPFEEEITENYFFKFQGSLIKKQVTYFVAEVEGNITLQQDEIKDSRWLEFPEALLLIDFKESRTIAGKVFNRIGNF